LNDYIDFPPILKKLEVETTRENIGGYMYDFLEENRLPREKKEMKLTQLLSTHGRFMSFGMYELWGLIDDCHFIVDEVQTLILFTKHDKIGTFVNDVFQRRIDAKSKGENAMWKNILNSSYGSDGQNNEKFTNVKFTTAEKAMRAVSKSNFVHSAKIGENLYLVHREPTSVSCKKPLQTAFATLSNAKYWFVSFVYKFMYRCLDRERFHFMVCDTDSFMWAVAGTGRRQGLIRDVLLDGVSQSGKDRVMGKIVQHFEEIVVDREFYEKNYELWFPKKKKLLTLEYEHCCTNLIALAPKNYWTEWKGETDFRGKGVSTRGNLNQELKELETIKRCLFGREIIEAKNYVLRQKKNKMTKQLISKTGISGVHTKMIVLENQSCLPFVYGKTAADYSIAEDY
jgi:hypothetical protein